MQTLPICSREMQDQVLANHSTAKSRSPARRINSRMTGPDMILQDLVSKGVPAYRIRVPISLFVVIFRNEH